MFVLSPGLCRWDVPILQASIAEGNMISAPCRPGNLRLWADTLLRGSRYECTRVGFGVLFVSTAAR